MHKLICRSLLTPWFKTVLLSKVIIRNKVTSLRNSLETIRKIWDILCICCIYLYHIACLLTSLKEVCVPCKALCCKADAMPAHLISKFVFKVFRLRFSKDLTYSNKISVPSVSSDGKEGALIWEISKISFWIWFSSREVAVVCLQIEFCVFLRKMREQRRVSFLIFYVSELDVCSLRLCNLTKVRCKY